MSRPACRVLFVDDQHFVLEGIRRALHSQSALLQTSFAESAGAALQWLEGNECDVVVTDLRMPDMDGTELLAELSRRRPEVLRVLLSGQLDEVAQFRAGRSAHRVLVKPVAPLVLASTIRNLFAVNDRLADVAARAAVNAIQTLPTSRRLHDAASGTADRSPSDPDVAELILQDPNAAANVLKLVGCGFAGAQTEFPSLVSGISYLGAPFLRAMVMADSRCADDGDDRRTFAAYRRRSVLAAAIARRIVPRRTLADQAFMAGLFHDIGSVIQPRSSTAGVETARVGAYLLALWNVAPTVVEAVQHHRDPMEHSGQEGELVLALHVASALAKEMNGEEQSGRASLDTAYLNAKGALARIPEWRVEALEAFQSLSAQGALV